MLPKTWKIIYTNDAKKHNIESELSSYSIYKILEQGVVEPTTNKGLNTFYNITSASAKIKLRHKSLVSEYNVVREANRLTPNYQGILNSTFKSIEAISEDEYFEGLDSFIRFELRKDGVLQECYDEPQKGHIYYYDVSCASPTFKELHRDLIQEIAARYIVTASWESIQDKEKDKTM